MVDDYFSVADISALVFVDFAKWVKKRIPEDHHHLARWYEQVSSRPSFKA
jgi:glutathione S-transferase